MAFPNLARDPFVNLRPLRRTSRALLVLGIGLTLFNILLFASYLLDSADLRSRLRELRGEITQERTAIDQASRRLASFDLEAQNQRVEFLNQRIAHRRFRWSQLFEDLGEVLPPGVRLNALSPELGRRSSREPTDERMALKMIGEARDSEQLLELVDALFAHPAFGEPKLASENRTDALLVFDLSVDYLTPRRPSAESSEDPEVQITDERSGEPGGEDTPPSEAAGAATATESGSAEPREVAARPAVSSSASPVAPEAEAPGVTETPASSRAEEGERRSMVAAPSTSSSARVASEGGAAEPSAGRDPGAPARAVAGSSATRSAPPPPPSDARGTLGGADSVDAPSTSPSPSSPTEASPRQPTPRQPSASSPPGATP